MNKEKEDLIMENLRLNSKFRQSQVVINKLVHERLEILEKNITAIVNTLNEMKETAKQQFEFDKMVIEKLK